MSTKFFTTESLSFGFSTKSFVNVVSTKPGAIQLTLTPMYPNSKAKEFLSQLDGEELEMVRAASDYLADVRQTMMVWFNESISDRNNRAIRDDIALSKAWNLTSAPSGRTIKAKKNSLQDKKRVVKWLKNAGYKWNDVRIILDKRAKKDIKSLEARQLRLKQALKMWNSQ